MIKMISFFLPILWVCFTELQCETSVDPWWDPRVWPDTLVEDGKPFLEITCGAYLKSQEWLSWRSESYRIYGLPSLQRQLYDGYSTLKLLWPLASLNNTKVYCLKRNETDTRSKSMCIQFEKNKYPGITFPEQGPWLMPAEFEDDGKRIKLTSYAYLYKSKKLSCLQKKDGSVYDLGMIQQGNKNSYVKITLRKTLEPSDNGSVVYCTDQYKESNYVTLTFEKPIEAFEPYVTVEPSTDVVFFDEGDDLEFVCGGSEPVDVHRLTWYLQAPGFNQVIIPSDQYIYKNKHQNRLNLRIDAFDHGKQLYCAQYIPYGSVREVRSRTITLLHRPQCDKRDQPRAIPATFVDEYKPRVQFTCYAFLEPGQLLAWYQSKGKNKRSDIIKRLNKSAGSLLRMIQLQDPGTKEGEWTVLTLNKTLEPFDNGREIYCAQQSVRADGSLSDGNQTERILVTIQRDIPSLERPFIRVEPDNASVSFDVNTTLRLSCGGSKPVDGRTYTWFKKESESNLTVPKDQKYDAITNLNVLYLSLNESHHLNKLFCAQGFLSYVRHTDGSLHVRRYGEVVASNIITLIQQEKNGSTRLLLLVTTSLALFSLAAAAAACWKLRRRRAAPPAPPAPTPPAPAPTDNTDESKGDYVNVSRMASPQVSDAVLGLPRGAVAARAPPAPDQALYAEVARAPPQQTYAALDLPRTAREPPAPEPSLYAEIARDHKR